ncbi:hypothetical protein J9B83_00475 [Marinomonas sp. A79]|uniref:Uncharacterized protein n=1 Tax=Marinomonas vulgaris TaxID=2823372 RepID=A0ABS5H6Q4_9GAMM|nr:hypothetical protein [Marinomonas vulgaris]MBR7887397.1 hypothetical protein [Marinomonas vulgaris]
MNKINMKAILLVFFLQLAVGVAWYASMPASLSAGSLLGDGLSQPPVNIVLLVACAAFVYVFFSAWLLVKTRGKSSAGGFFLVIGTWLFAVLPNFVFIAVHLNMNSSDALYLLSFGAISALLAAIILPLWPSSRLIFKS